MRTTTLSFLLFAVPMLAQAPAVDVPGGRRLTLLDAGVLLPGKGPDLVMKIPTDKPAPLSPDPLAAVAAFVRRFAQPALESGDDVQPLGGRYLAVLASPDRCAGVEEMLRTAATRRDDLLVFEAHLMQLPEATYTKVVAPLFDKNSTPEQRKVMILAGDLKPFLDAVQAAGANVLQVPQVSTRPLCPANVHSGEQIAYVRDFTIEKHGEARIANPVIDVVEDGIDLQVLATYSGDSNVFVDCQVRSDQVKRPLSEAKVDLGVGQPVMVQMPQVSTVRLAQAGVMPLRSALLLSAPRADGSWLCALLRVRKQP